MAADGPADSAAGRLAARKAAQVVRAFQARIATGLKGPRYNCRLLNTFSWPWIAGMVVAPLPIATLLAIPVWRRREVILGNIAGMIVIFGTAVALIMRESVALDAARQACFDSGATVCVASPSAFARYATYS